MFTVKIKWKCDTNASLYYLFTWLDWHVVPGIKSAKEENDEPHYALGVPPLHDTWGTGWWGLCSADAHIGHQAQKAGVTLPI